MRPSCAVIFRIRIFLAPVEHNYSNGVGSGGANYDGSSFVADHHFATGRLRPFVGFNFGGLYSADWVCGALFIWTGAQLVVLALTLP